MPAPLPLIPGMEGAGVVVAAGSAVASLFPVNSKVGYMGIGVQSAAEFTLVDASKAVPITGEHASTSFEDISGAMMQGMTAHYLVSADGSYEVKAGDYVLIHAGAGGMGLLLTQICKAKGATVVTTVSSAEKKAKSESVGADLVLRYAKDDGSEAEWMEQARAATKGKGFNVVYDSVGKSTFTQSLDLVAKRGTVVLFGAASGAPDAIAPLSLGPKSIKLTRPMLFHYVANEEELRKRAYEVLYWIKKGQVKFQYTKYPLEDAANAHAQLEGRNTSGKLLLQI